jgi:hypothetical protein
MFNSRENDIKEKCNCCSDRYSRSKKSSTAFKKNVSPLLTKTKKKMISIENDKECGLADPNRFQKMVMQRNNSDNLEFSKIETEIMNNTGTVKILSSEHSSTIFPLAENFTFISKSPSDSRLSMQPSDSCTNYSSSSLILTLYPSSTDIEDDIAATSQKPITSGKEEEALCKRYVLSTPTFKPSSSPLLHSLYTPSKCLFSSSTSKLPPIPQSVWIYIYI